MYNGLGLPKPAGHPGRGVTVFDTEQFAEMLAHDLCAELDCQSWADADDNPLHGRVIASTNSNAHDIYPEHLQKYCFTCAFWYQMLETANDGTLIVETTRVPYDGSAKGLDLCRYQFNPKEPIVKNSRGQFLGFGGSIFNIKFFATESSPERFVKTNNLWHQGTVPDHLRDRFKVNAVFVDSFDLASGFDLAKGGA